jgi:hypothetical protein
MSPEKYKCSPYSDTMCLAFCTGHKRNGFSDFYGGRKHSFYGEVKTPKKQEFCGKVV